MEKCLIIGLDCAAPQFVFNEYRKDLPNLAHLMEQGVYGELRSTVPPITVPAWTSMLSGKDPGQLGFFGFRNRRSYQYEELYFANASYIREKRVWNYLDEHGLRSIVIGVPQTFPPKPINGIMVGSFLTPDKSADYTFPSSTREDIDQIADGDYIIDVKDFRTEDKDWLLEQIYLMTRRRFRVVRHYLQNEAWNLFMFVEMGIDRIHHGFWRYQDKQHRLYQAGHRFENVILDYYRYVDGEIGRLFELLHPETAVMVVSDHGAKGMKGAICVNDWLIQKGYLHLRCEIQKPTKLTAEMIDWSQTRAWAEGGYYSRLFLNVQGREPQGVIPQSEYETFRNHIKEELEALGDEKNQPIGTRIFKPERVYRTVRNIPPDLIVYFGDLNWRSAGTVGNGAIHIFKNDTGPDDANHSEEGIFIFKPDRRKLKDAGLEKGQEIEGLSIYDIAPTLLNHFGLSVPIDMIGKPILNGGAGAMASDAPIATTDIQGEEYSDDEQAKIQKRLEDLGYL